MARKRRYWETARYRKRQDKIDAQMVYHRPDQGWIVCPCHGRRFALWPWQGKIRR